MEDHIIETSIDNLVQILREKGKMNISEAADFLKITQRQVEPLLNILEENGIIEIKYPVIGEPKIVLKSTVPEKIEIKRTDTGAFENKESETIEEIEKPKIKERAEFTGMKEEEMKHINEKVERLETKITELSGEMDISMLKEELFEVLLIIAGLKNIEKISFYLKEILSLIHKMKEKKIWTNEDKDLTVTMLRDISDNWKDYGENEISNVFDEVRIKIETA